jgi:hypothetical protein
VWREKYVSFISSMHMRQYCLKITMSGYIHHFLINNL